MQRPIKFRAQGRDSDDWYYGYYVEKHGEPTIVEAGGYAVYVRPETRGQFTGLLDKHGREIYEWDIVNRYGGGLLGDPSRILFTGKVIFTRRGYNISYMKNIGTIHSVLTEQHGNMFNESELEVIGNCFDQPQLLEGEL